MSETTRLESQIDEVLSQPADEIDPLEVAVLAGLLTRVEPDHPAVKRARALLDGELSDATDVALVQMPIDEVALAIFDEDLSWEARLDRLFALDELCVAALFADYPERVTSTVEIVVAGIHASSCFWCEFSDAAAAVLEETRFDREDPARLFWAAIEAAKRGETDVN